MDETINNEVTDEDVKEMIGEIGKKARILLSVGMLNPMHLMELATALQVCQEKKDMMKLKQLDNHMAIGLGAVANEKAFPVENCENCSTFPECQKLMEGIKPITKEEMDELSKANAEVPLGNA